MARQFRSSRNAGGEWSLADLAHGYRICRYNHEPHGGTHIHYPLDGPIVAFADLRDETEADHVLRAYAKSHAAFDLTSFHRVISEWKSKSKND